MAACVSSPDLVLVSKRKLGSSIGVVPFSPQSARVVPVDHTYSIELKMMPIQQITYCCRRGVRRA